MIEHQHPHGGGHEHSHEHASQVKAASILLVSIVILSALAGLLLINTHRVLITIQDEARLFSAESILYSQEEHHHTTNAATHRASLLEEAVREAPAKEGPVVKRLALSIALMKNGTGFEDRLAEKIAQNASDQEIEALRSSFLSSLFENYPPALKRQEAIQMQMDALLMELRDAESARSNKVKALDQARQRSAMADTWRDKESLSMKSLVFLLLSAALLAIQHTSRAKPALWLGVASLLTGILLLARGILL